MGRPTGRSRPGPARAVSRRPTVLARVAVRPLHRHPGQRSVRRRVCRGVDRPAAVPPCDKHRATLTRGRGAPDAFAVAGVECGGQAVCLDVTSSAESQRHVGRLSREREEGFGIHSAAPASGAPGGIVRSRSTGSQQPRIAARRLHFVGPWQSRPGHECTPFFGTASAARSRTRHRSRNTLTDTAISRVRCRRAGCRGNAKRSNELALCSPTSRERNRYGTRQKYVIRTASGSGRSARV